MMKLLAILALSAIPQITGTVNGTLLYEAERDSAPLADAGATVYFIRTPERLTVAPDWFVVFSGDSITVRSPKNPEKNFSVLSVFTMAQANDKGEFTADIPAGNYLLVIKSKNKFCATHRDSTGHVTVDSLTVEADRTVILSFSY